jgi:hypothetical protein
VNNNTFNLIIKLVSIMVSTIVFVSAPYKLNILLLIILRFVDN